MTCLPMIGQLCDTIIMGSYDRVLVLINHSMSNEKSWKLLSATLTVFNFSSRLLVYSNLDKSAHVVAIETPSHVTKNKSTTIFPNTFLVKATKVHDYSL